MFISIHYEEDPLKDNRKGKNTSATAAHQPPLRRYRRRRVLPQPATSSGWFTPFPPASPCSPPLHLNSLSTQPVNEAVIIATVAQKVHRGSNHRSPPALQSPPRRHPSRLTNHHQSVSHLPSSSALRRQSKTPASTLPTIDEAITSIDLSLSKMVVPVTKTTK